MFTDADVNGWFFTIAGLDPANGNTQPVPEPFLDEYVNELNAGATPAQIQANLENFPFNSNPPPTNVITDTFFRTSVADFVLREFQLAWGVVPTSGAAASQYDAWVARVINDPALLTNGGMSQALAGTTQFMVAIGATSPDQPATIGMINALAANAGVAVGSGAQALVGQPIWVALQTFATSTLVSNALAPAIANFQNLLLNAAPGAPPPSGSILTLPGTVGSSLTLTTGVDTPTTGFSTGHGATALAAGSIFNAAPANNPPLGVSNTLNIGDDLETKGAAIGATTLNYTAVSGGPFAVNPPLVTDLVMNGVNAAVITNVSGALAGFSGNITGLTSATLALTSTNNVRLGVAGNGLNTALTDVTVNASHNFTAFMTAAALAAAPSGTVHLLGNGVTTDVALNVTGGTTGYAQLTVDSGGTGANNLTLDIGTATNTATVVATGAEFLTLQGTALDIANLHTFTGTADTGGVSVTFNVASTGAGNVAATGGSGDDTFRFLDTGTGFASFLSTSSVDGGTGTNTLVIQADTGAIFDIIGPPGFVPGSNIVNIQTVVHETDGVAATNLTADLVALGSATTFDLAGNYNLHNVSVTDITNAQTVEYSGTGLNHLTLLHAAPGLGDIINFTMDQTLAGGTLDLTQLRVAAQVPALDQIDLNSTGNAALNQIDDVHLVDANILVTGATSLQLGDNPGDAYDLRNGTIDAQQMTGGGTSAWLAPTAGSAANFMTFIAGPTGTTNVVNLATAGGAVIDFTHSGNDTVEFHATAVGGNPLADTAHNYNNVLASTTVAPSININVGDIPTFNTNGGAVVADDATHALSFTTGTTVDGRLNADNFINITTPITSSGVETAQTGFAAAIGGGLGDGIEVTGPAHNFLLSYYDNTTGNAVLLTATSHPFLLVEEVNATSTIHVVGLIHESAAQYASIASQVHFV